MTRVLFAMLMLSACQPKPKTMTCTFKPLPGWTISPSPMPDHVLEALGPTLQSDVIIKVSKHSHLEAALAETQRWFRDAWGTEPGFFAESNQGRNDGLTSRTWWGDPKQLQVLYVRPMLGRVIVIHIRGMKADKELDDLLTMLDSLRCS